MQRRGPRQLPQLARRKATARRQQVHGREHALHRLPHEQAERQDARAVDDAHGQVAIRCLLVETAQARDGLEQPETHVDTEHGREHAEQQLGRAEGQEGSIHGGGSQGGRQG